MVDASPGPSSTGGPPYRHAAMDLPDRRTRADAAAQPAEDVFAREGWASLVLTAGAHGAAAFVQQVSLVWVRPDAFAGGDPAKALSTAEETGFRPVAALPVTVGRCALRALWSAVIWQATAEGLWLLDAITALGPGLLVLFADDRPLPGLSAAERMTIVKGPSNPRRRPADCLRTAIGSPDAALTMIHSADDPQTLARELGVFTDWGQRGELLRQAQHHQLRGRLDLDELVAACLRQAHNRAVARPEHGPLATEPLREPTWPQLRAAALQWPLSRPGVTAPVTR
jgi:hypothetical protein